MCLLLSLGVRMMRAFRQVSACFKRFILLAFCILVLEGQACCCFRLGFGQRSFWKLQRGKSHGESWTKTLTRTDPEDKFDKLTSNVQSSALKTSWIWTLVIYYFQIQLGLQMRRHRNFGFLSGSNLRIYHHNRQTQGRSARLNRAALWIGGYFRHGCLGTTRGTSVHAVAPLGALRIYQMIKS